MSSHNNGTPAPIQHLVGLSGPELEGSLFCLPGKLDRLTVEQQMRATPSSVDSLRRSPDATASDRSEASGQRFDDKLNTGMLDTINDERSFLGHTTLPTIKEGQSTHPEVVVEEIGMVTEGSGE